MPAAIVGGSEVSPYSLPWQVGIVSPGSVRTWCGGTLVGPRHVLTAAHCMGNDFEVVVGEHEITSSEDGTRHEVCGVTSHPRYATHGDNDFAIVRLKEPVAIGTRAVPACLPDAAWGIDSGFLDDKTMTVSGWGTTSSGGSSANALLSVDVPGISNAVCTTKYSASAMNHNHTC